MNGIQVGVWEASRQGDRFAYADTWLSNPQSRALSLSLPFLPGNAPCRGEAVSRYFDNLLPDSDAIRRRLAQRFQAKGTDSFHLLAKIGRDCAGAIQLLPEGETPTDIHKIQGQFLSDAEIARYLRGVTSDEPLGQTGGDDGLRLSIAGAQEKTALLQHEGRWLLPIGSTPTTHILKLPLGLVGHRQADMRTSVENEWLCGKIIAAYGVPIANSEIANFEEQKALVVERFDRLRSPDAKGIIRLPQEDFCQAMGVSPLQKYQSEGGPGISSSMNLLLGSANKEQDRYHFFKTQILFWVLAATDGHGKNFSLAHLPGANYRMTPIYDVLSAHPVIGAGKNKIPYQKAKLAMAVRGSTNHYLIHQIQRRHWVSQGLQAGISAQNTERLIEEVIDQTGRVIDHVARLLSKEFPADLADAIFEGMKKQCRRLSEAD
jgi:serine/threonine-protein kinase HipA